MPAEWRYATAEIWKLKKSPTRGTTRDLRILISMTRMQFHEEILENPPGLTHGLFDRGEQEGVGHRVRQKLRAAESTLSSASQDTRKH